MIIMLKYFSSPCYIIKIFYMAQFQNAFLFLTNKIYTVKNIFDENISLKKTSMVVGKIAPPPSSDPAANK